MMSATLNESLFFHEKTRCATLFVVRRDVKSDVTVVADEHVTGSLLKLLGNKSHEQTSSVDDVSGLYRRLAPWSGDHPNDQESDRDLSRLRHHDDVFAPVRRRLLVHLQVPSEVGSRPKRYDRDKDAPTAKGEALGMIDLDRFVYSRAKDAEEAVAVWEAIEHRIMQAVDAERDRCLQVVLHRRQMIEIIDGILNPEKACVT